MKDVEKGSHLNDFNFRGLIYREYAYIVMVENTTFFSLGKKDR